TSFDNLEWPSVAVCPAQFQQNEDTMIWGLSAAAFTELHVIISLIGIGSGLLVAFGLIKGKRFAGATAIFLVTTILTSVTGFAFPKQHITPGIVVGILSCIGLAFA